MPKETIAPRIIGTLVKRLAGDPVPFEIVKMSDQDGVPPKVLFRRPGVADAGSYAVDPNYDPAVEQADWRALVAQLADRRPFLVLALVDGFDGEHSFAPMQPLPVSLDQARRMVIARHARLIASEGTPFPVSQVIRALRLSPAEAWAAFGDPAALPPLPGEAHDAAD